MVQSHNAAPTKIHLVLAALTIVWTASLQGAVAKDVGWILHQRSTIYGKQILKIDQSGLELLWPKLNVVVYIQAPDWKVQICNDKYKTFCVLDIAEFRRSALSEAPSTTQIQKWIYQQKKPEVIGGVKSNLYEGIRYLRDANPKEQIALGKVNPAKPQTPDSQIFKIYSLGEKQPPKETPGPKYWLTNQRKKVWLSQEIKVPTPLTEMLTRSTGLPARYGVPLKLQTWNVNDKANMNMALTTEKVERAQLPAPDQAKRKGYRKVKDFMAVAIGDEHDDDLDELLNMSARPGSRPSQKKPMPPRPRK